MNNTRYRSRPFFIYSGHVREWTKGVKTEYLEYEAYIPMAEKKLAQIGDEINEAIGIYASYSKYSVLTPLVHSRT
jgi:molybdopterin synthase catalytic subunit